MADRIVPFYKTPHIDIRTSIQQIGALTTFAAAVGLIGHQDQVDSGTGLIPRLVPTIGYPQVEYFKPFQLPNFGTAIEALAYMKNLGFTINYGLSGSLVLPPPDTVTTALDGVTLILGYTTVPANYNLLLNPSLTGELTQGANTGVFGGANPNVPEITVKTPTGVFNTTTLITFDFVNNAINLPDSERTDEICIMVYNAFAAATQINGGEQYNFIRPTFYISVLTPREIGGSFAPNATPVTLGNPTAVAVQTDGSVYVGWATPPANSVYVPINSLGQSKLEQTTAVTGVINKTLPPFTIAGCEFVVKLVDVIGVFATATATTLVLDAAQTVFTYLDNVTLTAIVNPYEVKTNADITTNQAAFFNYIQSINQPSQIEGGHFGTFGVFANVSNSPFNVSTLPNAINFQWYAPVYYPYFPLLGEVPQAAAAIATGYCSAFSCNSAPYNPMSGIIIPGLLASQDQSNNIVIGLTGANSSEAVLDLGWTPLSVNSSLQVSPVRPITGLLTIPGTEIADQEFFPLTTWQIVTAFQQNLYVRLLAAGIKQRRMTPLVISSVKGTVIGLMMTFQDPLGMFQNVENLSKLVVVRQSNVPDTLLIDVPITVIPELASASVQVGLISSLITLT